MGDIRWIERVLRGLACASCLSVLAACSAEGGEGGGGVSSAGVGGSAAGQGAVGGSGGSAAVAGQAGMGGVGAVGGAGGFGGVGGVAGVGGASGSGGVPNECGGITARAEAQVLPTDVIWAIDTSGSMNASFPAIQQALNTFSQRVIAAGIDAHIILLAGAGAGGGGIFGSGGLCVPAPLGSGTCGNAPMEGGVAPDSREPAFLHLDLPFGSTAGMATLLDNHPRYRHLLRSNARTQLVLTEDGAPPMTAAAVTNHVEGRSAATLTPAWMPGLVPGSYQWNGVVCVNGTGAGTCFLAFGVPQTTIDLINATNGLVSNLDDAGNMAAMDPFAALLDRLAEAVIVGATVSCTYDIPPAPQGETFDRERVNVEYSSGTQRTTFLRAPEGVDCGNELAWKFDNEQTPTRVVLCPSACNQVQADAQAQIDLSFGCETMILMPD